MRVSFSFKVCGRRIMSTLTIVPEPKEYTMGMASRCADGKHVLFLDYDGIAPEVLDEELEILQEIKRLSIFGRFCTDKKRMKYHAVCLDKFTISELFNDIIPRSSCDLAFQRAPKIYEYRSWVLRDFPKGDKNKPEFIGFLNSKWNEREQSSFHAKWIWLNYGVVWCLAKPDNLLEGDIASYKTAVGLK